MARANISLYQLAKLYPDEVAARAYIEARRWTNGVTCPACPETRRITPRRNGFYRCNACKKDFTVRTGTIFERSHVQLDKWIFAMHMLMTARNGVSSLQLARDIGVTQKTAWFMLGRIREACEDDPSVLSSIVEIGETSFGSNEKNDDPDKKLNRDSGTAGKTAVPRVRERGKRSRRKARQLVKPTNSNPCNRLRE